MVPDKNFRAVANVLFGRYDNKFWTKIAYVTPAWTFIKQTHSYICVYQIWKKLKYKNSTFAQFKIEIFGAKKKIMKKIRWLLTTKLLSILNLVWQVVEYIIYV